MSYCSPKKRFDDLADDFLIWLLQRMFIYVCNRFLYHPHSLTYKGPGCSEAKALVRRPFQSGFLSLLIVLKAHCWPWPDDTLKIIGWHAKTKNSQVNFRNFMMLMKCMDMLTARLIWYVLLSATWQWNHKTNVNLFVSKSNIEIIGTYTENSYF